MSANFLICTTFYYFYFYYYERLHTIVAKTFSAVILFIVWPYYYIFKYMQSGVSSYERLQQEIEHELQFIA